jgi:hypothetical protein
VKSSTLFREKTVPAGQFGMFLQAVGQTQHIFIFPTPLTIITQYHHHQYHHHHRKKGASAVVRRPDNPVSVVGVLHPRTV